MGRKSVLPRPTLADVSRWNREGILDLDAATKDGDDFQTLTQIVDTFFPTPEQGRLQGKRKAHHSGLRVALTSTLLRAANATGRNDQDRRHALDSLQLLHQGLSKWRDGAEAIRQATSAESNLWRGPYDRHPEVTRAAMALSPLARQTIEASSVQQDVEHAIAGLKFHATRNEFLEILLADLRALWRRENGSYPAQTKNATSSCRFPLFVARLLLDHLKLQDAVDPPPSVEEMTDRLRVYYTDLAMRLGWKPEREISAK